MLVGRAGSGSEKRVTPRVSPVPEGYSMLVAGTMGSLPSPLELPFEAKCPTAWHTVRV